MGRKVQETQPGGRTVHYEYTDRGELKKTWGSDTYPVEYTYEKGRMSTMTTWKDFDLNAGSATTAWSYNARGLVAEKTDADGKSVAYTYTPAGRLATRA